MRIGVISDTHGLFDRSIIHHFAGVEHILHAGDIGPGDVLAQLERIAPVTAVSGNVDGFEASGIPVEQTVELAGYRIALYHRLYEGGRLTRHGNDMLARIRPAVCVYGHTHQPKAEWRDGVLLFNPGSAGPKRFRLPRAVGVLLFQNGSIETRHIMLADRAE
ncbi:MAG: Phosphoesterase [Nitrospira sp.]|nr:metallophosphoesterase family protein [Nitrospira sp.]ULA60925.1 MAG: Phosphoesterase [Nitrospira sp.]